MPKVRQLVQTSRLFCTYGNCETDIRWAWKPSNGYYIPLATLWSHFFVNLKVPSWWSKELGTWYKFQISGIIISIKTDMTVNWKHALLWSKSHQTDNLAKICKSKATKLYSTFVFLQKLEIFEPTLVFQMVCTLVLVHINISFIYFYIESKSDSSITIFKEV